MARAALDRGAEILVFPELFLTGFCYETFPRHQQTTRLIRRSILFAQLAKEHECLIIGSIRCGRLNLGFCLDSDWAWSCAPRSILSDRRKSTLMAETSSHPWPQNGAGWAFRSATTCASQRWRAPWHCRAQTSWSRWPSSPHPAWAQWRTLCPCQGHRESDSSPGLQLGGWRWLSDHQCPGHGAGRGEAGGDNYMGRYRSGRAGRCAPRDTLLCRPAAGDLLR